ncbi:MAG: antibiotic biosynthesis monooxygenase [Bacteroidales bacterium]|jgi:quinol monooxygenase YgiN|nr:antibiotic biosynthesis monooxygenase [Bacteroidales bacterium]
MKNKLKNFILLFLSVYILMSCGSSDTPVKNVEDNVSTGNELTIVANVTINPEFKDELMKTFQVIVNATRKEPGNISYGLYENTQDPLKFTFVEKWKSQDAINTHNNSAHFQEFVKAVEGKAELEVMVLKQKF